MTSLENKLKTSSTAAPWKRIGIYHHIGIDIPLGALRSKDSCGIGEFFDLIPLIDWCAELKMDIIQLLPLNDTGYDPSPYNALSSCAIHPIYLSLYKLPYLDDPYLLEQIKELHILNSSEKISFEIVLTRKMHVLSLYFKKYQDSLIDSSSFKSFISQNDWIKSYALFKALQHEMGHSPFSSWPDHLKYVSPEEFKKLANTYQNEMFFYQVLQYLCFTQLTEVKKIANNKKVFLKGDLPILINPTSADVWFYPELFNLDLSVGSAPDVYCREGQNWGFPGIHWTDMKKDGFSWWKQRLRYTSHFYDLYRIDHVIGLFRLWTIPLGHTSKDGAFTPSDENLWGPHGKEILDILTKGEPMLPIAEDLGVVPNMVRPILNQMGIPGTKVMRWERNWEGDLSFIDPKEYPEISLTCVSTHDSPTLEQWWRDYPEEAGLYAKENNWKYAPKITYFQRQSILKTSLTSSSLFHINLLSEYLALIPSLVAPNPDHERINIPGVVLPSNWIYKFRHSVEEITQNSLLKEEMKKILPSLLEGST